MRLPGILLAALLALHAGGAAAEEARVELPDIVTILSMAVTDQAGAPVTQWAAEKPLRGEIRFAIGGREGEEVPVIVRVALETEPTTDSPWADLLDGRLIPGEYSYTWDFTVPPARQARSGRLVWSVKASYYVPGRLLPWVLANHVSQPLDFDGRTIREIRANPSLAESTRQGVWVRNRQADRSYPIVP